MTTCYQIILNYNKTKQDMEASFLTRHTPTFISPLIYKKGKEKIVEDKVPDLPNKDDINSNVNN